MVKKIKGVDTALIYGSYAKGALRHDSDVDILIVAGQPEAEDALLKEINSIEQKVKREVNYKIYDKSEFRQKLRNNDPFLEEILSDKYILLKGNL